MTQAIRRSISYTQGVGRSRNGHKVTYYGHIPPRCITVCESCGQSHEEGKNHLYDYPLEVDDDLMCQICLQPLVDPVDTPCGHTFCYNCIFSHLNRSPTCPTDRHPISKESIKQSSLLVRKILDKLRVVCPNTAYCDATMPRSSLERHLKISCQGTYVRCPRGKRGCHHVGPRNQLEEHLWTCLYGEDCHKKSGKKIPIEEGRSCIVEIPKGDGDLGLSVSQCERTGALVIDEIFVGGNAYKDGRLMPGDQILEIDNNSFTHKSLAEAKLALCALKPLIRLSVLRSPYQEYECSDIEEVQLIKEHYRPLGIQIHTYKTQSGIYVHHVSSGSVAEECGCLQVGDRILEINGVDVRRVSIDEAATLMARSSGVLILLVAHKHRLSPTCSDISNKSNLSACSQGSLPHRSLRKQRVYEEIIAPTGYPIGSAKCIIIKKCPDQIFGMSISGGIDSACGDLPVFVSDITPGSVIDQYGKIQCGDILLSINNISLSNKTHEEAVQTLKSLTSASVVRMELLQGDDVFEEDGGLSPDWSTWLERYMAKRKSPLEYTITLSRKGSGSLGFSIVGGVNSRHGNSPIYIKGIASKSIADIDGRLKCRDQITSINGQLVAYCTQSEVVNIIKKSSGDLTLTIIPYEINQ